jgi:hypothetical protein
LDRRRKPRGPFFLKFAAGWEMQTRISSSDGVKKAGDTFGNIELRAGNRKAILVALRLGPLDMIAIESVAVAPVRETHQA